MSLSAFLGIDRTKIQNDFGFTESIYQHMRIPDRLKLSGGTEDNRAPVLPDEMPPLAYSMQIPERLSLAETSIAGLRSSLNQMQQDTSILDISSNTSENQSTKTGQTSASPKLMQKGSQRRLRKHSHSLSAGHSVSDSSHVLSRAQVQPAPPPLPPAPPFPPFPSFEQNGNLFTVHNVYHTAKCLGQGISRLMVQSLVKKVHRSSGDLGIVEDIVPYDPNHRDVTAMRRQLSQISHRLDLLEKEVPIHRQKELLLISAVVLAALVNGWLWLRQ